MKNATTSTFPGPTERRGGENRIRLALTTALLLLLLVGIVVAADVLLEDVNTSSSPLAACPHYTCTYTIVTSYPHDPSAFTQGLVIEEGVLYEGTGLRGRSTLREVDLGTGTVNRSIPLAPEHFGEGITVYDDRIVQLTWQSNVGFAYDKDSFQLQEAFTYPTEGWGLTHDGTYLIMSDGTPTIHFLDPHTFEEIRRIEVLDGETPVVRLNELEYVGGEILANVWQTDRVARIDPQTGQVIGWIDLQGLLDGVSGAESANVLNGIAYDAGESRLFVTGKLWPRLFEIKLKPVGE